MSKNAQRHDNRRPQNEWSDEPKQSRREEEKRRQQERRETARNKREYQEEF